MFGGIDFGAALDTYQGQQDRDRMLQEQALEKQYRLEDRQLAAHDRQLAAEDRRRLIDQQALEQRHRLEDRKVAAEERNRRSRLENFNNMQKLMELAPPGASVNDIMGMAQQFNLQTGEGSEGLIRKLQEQKNKEFAAQESERQLRMVETQNKISKMLSGEITALGARGVTDVQVAQENMQGRFGHIPFMAEHLKNADYSGLQAAYDDNIRTVTFDILAKTKGMDSQARADFIANDPRLKGTPLAGIIKEQVGREAYNVWRKDNESKFQRWATTMDSNTLNDEVVESMRLAGVPEEVIESKQGSLDSLFAGYEEEFRYNYNKTREAKQGELLNRAHKQAQERLAKQEDEVKLSFGSALEGGVLSGLSEERKGMAKGMMGALATRIPLAGDSIQDITETLAANPEILDDPTLSGQLKTLEEAMVANNLHPPTWDGYVEKSLEPYASQMRKAKDFVSYHDDHLNTVDLAMKKMDRRLARIKTQIESATSSGTGYQEDLVRSQVKKAQQAALSTLRAEEKALSEMNANHETRMVYGLVDEGNRMSHKQALAKIREKIADLSYGQGNSVEKIVSGFKPVKAAPTTAANGQSHLAEGLTAGLNGNEIQTQLKTGSKQNGRSTVNTYTPVTDISQLSPEAYEYLEKVRDYISDLPPSKNKEKHIQYVIGKAFQDAEIGRKLLSQLEQGSDVAAR